MASTTKSTTKQRAEKKMNMKTITCYNNGNKQNEHEEIENMQHPIKIPNSTLFSSCLFFFFNFQ